MALRVPADKQAKTARGHTFFNGNGVYQESELEHRVSSVLHTLSGLRELQSQYPKVHYTDADGVLREHTFDYFIVLNDGTRVAVAVKYARKRAEMIDLLDRICAAGITGVGPLGKLTPRVADAVTLMTNEEATHEAFENAYFILTSRLHHDDAECARLVDVVKRLPGQFRFGDLLRDVRARDKRRTAVWRLIDLRLIAPVYSGRIDDRSWLRACA